MKKQEIMKSSSNKIEIPKKIFEQIFFANGGEKVAEVLTGSKQFEETRKQMVNANVEEDEWIKDSKGLREVEGDKHKEGGVDVHLENGARVLSDKLKVGSELAKKISKEYAVIVKPSNTYAEVLDKVQKKIGLDKVVDEQEKLIKRIDYQQKNVKDESTLSANLEILSKKLNELDKKKAPLEDNSKMVFDILFEKQEASKPKEDNQTVFSEGGEKTPPPTFRVANVLENLNAYIKQHKLDSGAYGESDKAKATESGRGLFPSIYARNFEEGSVTPKNSEALQLDLNKHYDSILKNAEKLYGVDSEKYKALKAQIDKDRFSSESDVRGIDNKYGNWTSTRPNFFLEILPKEVLDKVKKEGVNTIGQLKIKFPTEYETYVKTKGFENEDDIWLGEIPITNATEKTDKKAEEQSKPIIEESTETRYGVMDIPDQTPMIPSGMDAHLKTNRRYERLDFRGIDPEQQLVELNKLTERAENNLDMMPPQQRASLSANLLATQAEQTNKILTQVNQFNTQGQQQIDNMNAQIQTQENNANAQDALSYEQRQLLAEAKTEADFNKFYNKVQENNLRNYNFIDSTNLSNQFYDSFQITDKGIEGKGASSMANLSPAQMEILKQAELKKIEEKYKTKK